MKLVKAENCIPVKGYSRSAICDLQRHEIKLVPNALNDILIYHNGKTLEQIKENYSEEDHETIDEYVNFLIENEFAFYTENPEWFPHLSIQWDNPGEITNAIADINESSDYNLFKFIEYLSNLSCSALQLRFFYKAKVEYLEQILDYTEKLHSSILSLEILVEDSQYLSEGKLSELIARFPRLLRVIVHSSSEEKQIKSKFHDQATILYTSKRIKSEFYCGNINSGYFTPNMSMFTESMNHNSCLNGKIALDVEGNIKNCPSMKESYGNIKNTNLQAVLENLNFKSYWNITKDQIEICKDCEFRHVCTDCRAYIEKPEDNYSKPLKCGYNPYTNEWEEWSKNPLKQKAINYYGFEI